MIRKSDVMLSCGWLVITGSVFGVVLLPSAKKEQALLSEIARLRADLTQPTSGPEMIARLSSDLEALKEFGRGRMTPIPKQSNIAGLMASISHILDELGLEQSDITTKPAKQLDFASAMPVSVTLEGSFQKIYLAISRIEQLPRLIRVDRLRVSVPQTPNLSVDRSGTVRAEISLSAFFAPRDLAASAEKDDS